MLVLALLIGAAGGGLVAWLVSRSRAVALGESCGDLRTRLAAAERERDARGDQLRQSERDLVELQTSLDHEKRTFGEKIALLEQAKGELATSFKALCSDALKSNNTSFLELARTQLEQFQATAREDLSSRHRAVEQLVTPIKESLEKVDGQVRHLEQARREAYGSLSQQVQSLAETQDRLRLETGNLVTALRAPHVRGRWGEMQLKRVVEMAGMVAHCDFVEQATTVESGGRVLRPDLVVKLPGGKNVVVDAKAPLHAYLDGLEAPDEETRLLKLRDHARQVRDHITRLGAKAYWQQFSPTPDFVVMFLPDETFFKAALEHDPALIEVGVEAGVIPASPTTLIALLRTISYGWQQETVAESARAVSDLGRELYARLGVLGRHFGKLGRSLDSSVAAYNEAVGSLESRVLVTARRFELHGVSGDVPDLEPLERQARPLHALELTEGTPAESILDLALPTDANAA